MKLTFFVGKLAISLGKQSVLMRIVNFHCEIGHFCYVIDHFCCKIDLKLLKKLHFETKIFIFMSKNYCNNRLTFNVIPKLTGNDRKLSNCYVEYEKYTSKNCKLMIFGRAGFFLIFLIRFWRFLKNKNCLCWIKNIRVYVNLKCFSI